MLSAGSVLVAAGDNIFPVEIQCSRGNGSGSPPLRHLYLYACARRKPQHPSQVRESERERERERESLRERARATKQKNLSRFDESSTRATLRRPLAGLHHHYQRLLLAFHRREPLRPPTTPQWLLKLGVLASAPPMPRADISRTSGTTKVLSTYSL